MASPSGCGLAANVSPFWRTIEGRRVLLHMMAGSKEDAENCDGVLRGHEEARAE
jgi:hypothetical protein